MTKIQPLPASDPSNAHLLRGKQLQRCNRQPAHAIPEGLRHQTDVVRMALPTSKVHRSNAQNNERITRDRMDRRIHPSKHRSPKNPLNTTKPRGKALPRRRRRQPWPPMHRARKEIPHPPRPPRHARSPNDSRKTISDSRRQCRSLRFFPETAYNRSVSSQLYLPHNL